MLVVGSATLAILLVCFSLYQAWQNESSQDHESARQTVRRRTEPEAIPPANRQDASTAGDAAGIGPGENVSITIYPREGSKARLEVEVRDWSPLPGATDQFRLVNPKIRMLTSDDHAVRVTADSGVLEATRRNGTALDPQRGKLTGHVLIEYDRLSEAERAALPAAQRTELDPDQLVRVETETIEFDIEYSKLMIPGALRLSARDVAFSAANLELRFNESENRVETMRISGGGRVELLQVAGAEPLSGQPGDAGGRFTVVEWIRRTIQSQLSANDALAGAAPVPPSPRADETEDEDQVPVFHAEDLSESVSRAPVHYFAHFEGDIDATQHRGETLLSRLQSDTLDILRDFAEESPLGATPANTASNDRRDGTTAAPPEPTSPGSGDTVAVSWTDRLILRALASDDEALAHGVRSRVTATGSPARLSHPEGNAVCRQLVFDPDEGEIWLHGTDVNPAIVRQQGQGVLSGAIVHSRSEGDVFHVEITGPGELSTLDEETDAPGTRVGAATPEPTGIGHPVTNQPLSVDRQLVSFRDRMEARGIVKSKTTLDFSGHVSTKDYRVLESAEFFGQVSVGQKAVAMDADRLTVRFGIEESWRGVRQYIDGFHGTGNVTMVQKDDRLSCRELDVSLRADHTGRIWPRTVVAGGDVDAVQGERTIRARDELIVDFALYEQSPDTVAPPTTAPPPGSAISAEPGAANVPLATSPQGAETSEGRVVRSGVERLQATGEVHVEDPTQRLDLSAEQLDCQIAAQRGEIETATVLGTTERPASVRLADVTTIGQRINVNVPDEWVEIPGAGRMSLMSFRDLDGSTTTEPVPIVITWNTGMRYQGRENRAVFGGGVHAYSRSTTTFDCQRLEIEFDEVSATPAPASGSTASPWQRLPELVDRLTGSPTKSSSPAQRFNREPAVIWATGSAKAITSEIDEASGDLKTRMRIEGPKLAVYLRSEVSKMLIEGGGALLMEQFGAGAGTGAPEPPAEHTGELFDMSRDDGPSKTLIEWKDTMVYDFGIDQTRFEGDVSLKHFSGAALLDRFSATATDSNGSSAGRSTYLLSDTLTVDFLERSQRSKRDVSERMGRLSTSSLRQFEAGGRVRLNDTSEGLQVWADKIIYEKPRQLLAIYGDRTRKARIIKRRDQRLPLQLDVERLFYNLKTGLPEIADLDMR